MQDRVFLRHPSQSLGWVCFDFSILFDFRLFDFLEDSGGGADTADLFLASSSTIPFPQCFTCRLNTPTDRVSNPHFKQILAPSV